MGSEFIRGPKWRTRTAPEHRARAAVTTFAVLQIVGLILMVLMINLLEALDAPWGVTTMPFWLPTIAVLVWTLARPTPAVATDDDDDSWTTFSVRHVLVGEDRPRSAPLRILAAAVFGAPIAWALGLFGLLALLGLFEL